MFGIKIPQKNLEETVYQTLLDALNALGYDCDADPEAMSIEAIVPGDDLEIGFMAYVEEGRIRMSCILSISVPPERRRDLVWELNSINSELIYGCFTLGEDGIVSYDYTHIYNDTAPSPELMAALADLMVSTVDEYDGELDRVIWGGEGLHSRIGRL